MSVNLVSLVSEFLTPNLISRIGAALGLDRILVGRAAVALGPAILGSLSHAASTSEGARKLANTVSQQSPSILDTLGSMIGGAGQLKFPRFRGHRNICVSGVRDVEEMPPIPV